MRDVKVHAALLVLMALWAAQTWTREVPSAADRERPLVWDRDTAEVVAVVYRSDSREVRVTRRTDGAETYLWGEEIRESRSGQTESADTLRYPLGSPGSRLVAGLAELRVLRDLGSVDEARRSESGLDEPFGVLRIQFDDAARTLELGDEVFGARHRYAWSADLGRAYVLPSDLIVPLETGSGALRERRLHHFRDADVATVRVETGDGVRTMRRSAGGSGPATWAPVDAPDRPDQGFADFMDRVSRLAIRDFETDARPEALERLLRIEYVDDEGGSLGFVELYRGPGEPDDALYLRSERTRVLARAVATLAGQVAEEIPALLGGR